MSYNTFVQLLKHIDMTTGHLFLSKYLTLHYITLSVSRFFVPRRLRSKLIRPDDSHHPIFGTVTDRPAIVFFPDSKCCQPGLLTILFKSIADIRYRYWLQKYRRNRYRYGAGKVLTSISIFRYRYCVILSIKMFAVTLIY